MVVTTNYHGDPKYADFSVGGISTGMVGYQPGNPILFHIWESVK